MNDILKMLDGLIQGAQTKSKNRPSAQKVFTYRHCIAMIKAGWKATGCKKIGDETSDGIIITWRLGERSLEMPLSFNEQCRWIKHMEGHK